MAFVDGLRGACRAAAAASSVAAAASPATRTGGRPRRRLCAPARCEERPHRKRPAAGTSGACGDSGVRFYAARSRAASESPRCFAIVERLVQFAVVDGVGGAAGDDGSQCAKFCANRLSPLVARAFAERAQRTPLRAATRPDATLYENEEDAAAALWADALTEGFVQCDAAAQQEVEGACGALLCVVARSGVYVASVGLGRAVIGTDLGGEVLCDEVSIPHSADNEAEARRLHESAAAGSDPSAALPRGPTRLLGGAAAKRQTPALTPLPDVVRHRHSENRRFVLLGSPDLWSRGPRLPVQWAVEAYRAGRSPADELVARCGGADVVALVLVLPANLAAGEGLLPAHDKLFHSP